MRHALTTPGLTIYETNFVLFPYTTNLAFHTLTPLWFPAWALLEPPLGTMVAMNLIMAAAVALTGASFYALLRREGVPASFALAAGVALQTTPAMLFSAMLTNLNYLSLFWYPLTILIWGQVARHAGGRRGLVWAAAMGLALYGLLMTDYQHLLFAAFLLVPYGLLTLAQAGAWPARARLAGLGILALALAALLLWIAGPLPYILAFDRGSLAPQPIDKAQGIPFPLGYVWRLSPYSRALTLGALALPGAALALLAGRRARGRRFPARRWFWLALLPAPLLLSLGPSVALGDLTLPTPYVPFHQLFGGMFRVPARFAPVILIPALIFIGQTYAAWSPRTRARRAWAGAALLLLVAAEARLYEPMPLRPVARPYAFYQALGEERGAPYDDYAVVEVPVAGGSGEAWVGEFPPMETQWYGLTHGKRMLNGSIARAPLGHFWYWLYDDPMLAWLGQRRYLEPETVERQLRQRIFDWPIGYIVIHQDYIGTYGPTTQEIIGYFNALDELLCPVFVEGDAVAYRTAWHPDGCPPRTPPATAPGVYTLDMGASGDERFIGWGWHGPETVAGLTLRWTGEYPQTQVYLDLPPGAYTLTLAAQAFWEPRRLRLLVNGRPVGDPVAVSVDALREYAFAVPAGAVGDGRHVTVTLDYDAAVVPAEVGQSADARRLALAVDWLRFAREGG